MERKEMYVSEVFQGFLIINSSSIAHSNAIFVKPEETFVEDFFEEARMMARGSETQWKRPKEATGIGRSGPLAI